MDQTVHGATQRDWPAKCALGGGGGGAGRLTAEMPRWLPVGLLPDTVQSEKAGLPLNSAGERLWEAGPGKRTEGGREPPLIAFQPCCPVPVLKLAGWLACAAFPPPSQSCSWVDLFTPPPPLSLSSAPSAAFLPGLLTSPRFPRLFQGLPFTYA